MPPKSGLLSPLCDLHYLFTREPFRLGLGCGCTSHRMSTELRGTVLCKSNESEFRALFSSKYRRTFDRYFEAFARQLNEFSTTIRQGKRKIESKNRKANRKIASSNFRTSEISKKIRFKSNVISANFPTSR